MSRLLPSMLFLASCCGLFLLCSAELSSAEQKAMLSLRDCLTGGDHHWHGSDHPCEGRWDGVFCNHANTSVLQLSMAQKSVTGTLKSDLDLSPLTKLQFFDFGTNQLEGSLPTSLGSLTHLQAIWVNGNSLSGSLPASIFSLPSLQVFDCHENGFTGGLPQTGWSALTSLTVLDVASNNLSGTVPDGLASLPSLKFLYLTDNQFTTLPDMGKLPNLTGLFVNNNNLTGSLGDDMAASHSVTGKDCYTDVCLDVSCNGDGVKVAPSVVEACKKSGVCKLTPQTCK